MTDPPDENTTRAAVARAMRLPVAHRFRLAARLVRSPRVPMSARLPLAALLVYLAMPLDLIPDAIPVLGQLDDLLVAGIAVWWFLRVCPADVALAEIATLERTPLGAWGRALPRLLLALSLASALLFVALWAR